MAKKTNIVKRAKGNMQVVLIGAVAVGWLMTLAVLVKPDTTVQEQKALIEEAQLLLKDKLYIRVVQTYQRALNDYHTENNFNYETQLLNVYKEAGMTEEYYALLDKRIEEETASLEEFKIRVQSYIDQDNIKNAVALLKQKKDRYDDKELTDIYESIRYGYTVRTTSYTELGMPASDWYIPAYDAEKERWGYIRENGKTAIGFLYEEALPFDGEYTVARIGGVYTFIDKNGYWYSVDKNDLDLVTACIGGKVAGMKDGKYGIFNHSFQALIQDFFEDVCLNDNGMVFVKKGGKWALLDDSLEPVTDYIYSDIARNSRGQAFKDDYAIVADEKGYYLIDRTGQACYEQRFPLAKGLEGGNYAVADDSGNWGFANEKGEYVIDPQYEDAFSFSQSLAAVKVDGMWGYINSYATQIMEPQFNMAFPFFSGKALVVDEQGYYQILSLSY